MKSILNAVNDIYYLISLIQKRPGMYLTKKNIYSLDSFFNGLFMGYFLLDRKTQNCEGDKFNAFVEYIKEKIIFPDNNLYYNILLLASNNDQEKAFNLFFELFDEFKKEKGIVYEWDNPLPGEQEGGA